MSSNILNWQKTLSLCNGNPDLARQLVEMLRSDLPRQKQILLNAYEKHDTQMIRDIIHQILGSCSYISLPSIEKAAKEMHQAIHGDKIDLEYFKDQLIKKIDETIIYTAKNNFS